LYRLVRQKNLYAKGLKGNMLTLDAGTVIHQKKKKINIHFSHRHVEGAVVPTSATEPAINVSIPRCWDCVISGHCRKLDEDEK
jgi:hypothetical protein